MNTYKITVPITPERRVFADEMEQKLAQMFIKVAPVKLEQEQMSKPVTVEAHKAEVSATGALILSEVREEKSE